MAKNKAVHTNSNNGILIGMITALAIVTAIGLVLNEHKVITFGSPALDIQREQPTAIINLPPPSGNTVNVPTGNTGAATGSQNTLQDNIQAVPTIAPVGASGVPSSGNGVESGLTESMGRKFDENTSTNTETGVAGEILNVVESWETATRIPGGEPPVDNGGGKSFDRKLSGGTSGGKTWGP